MKTIRTAGAIFVSALALAACGSGGSEKAADNGANAAAGEAAAPAANGAAAAEGNAAEANAAAGEAPAEGGAQQDFTIVNNTGHAVLTLNVSPTDEQEWGPDILGAAILPNGERGTVRFVRGQEQCNWDIRATLDNGSTGAWQGVNLCETTTVTLTASE